MKQTLNIDKTILFEDWDGVKKFVNTKILGKTKDNGYDENGSNYNKENDINFQKQFQAPEVPEHMENINAITEGKNMQTLNIDKGIILEAFNLEDVEVNRSASALFEKASVKTVFDDKDIHQEDRDAKKEIQTRMVD